MRRSFLAILGACAGLSVSSLPAFAEEANSAYVQSENKVVAEMKSPRSLFLLRCSGCHQASGGGSLGGGVPQFQGYLGPMANDPEGRVYIAHVPGVVSARLNDGQLVDVLNYLIDEWGEDTQGDRPPHFTVEELQALKAVPVNNIVEYRRAVVARLAEQGHPVADYPWP